MSKIRINQIRSEDTVSQAEAEAGTSTSPKIWTPERVAQAIAALGGGGGGLSPIDLIKNPNGIISFTSGAVPFGSGLLSMTSYVANSRTAAVNAYGGYLQCNCPATIDSYARIVTSHAILSSDLKPIVAFKINDISTSYGHDFAIGLFKELPTTVGYNGGDNFIGLWTSTSYDLHKIHYITRTSNTSSTLSNYEIRHATDPRFFIIQYNSSTEVKFYLYDKDGTLLDEFTHTQYIPTGNFFVAAIVKNGSSSNQVGFKYWFINALHQIV